MGSDYSRILEIVNSIRRRWKVYLVLEGVLYTWAVLLVWLFMGIAMDNLFHLSFILRLFFLIVLLGLAAFMFSRRIMASLLKRINPDEAALYAESRLINMENRLINSLQLGRTECRTNRKIVELVIRETVSEVRNLKLESAVDRKRARKHLLMLSFVIVALILYWVILPMHFTNALARLTNLHNAPPPLTRISLVVKPGDARIFDGDNLVITAGTSNGELPEKVFIHIRTREKLRRERMDFDGSLFNHTIPAIKSETRYRVTSDDFKSEWYTISTTTPLRVSRIDIVFTFPEYLNIAGPFTLLNASEELRVLKGTHSEFHVFSNKTLSAGRIKLDTSDYELKVVGEKEAVGELDILRDISYGIYLKDAEGYELKNDIDRRIYCIVDESPLVELLEPASEYSGSVEEKLKIMVKGRDDVALAVLRLLIGKEETDTDDTLLKEWNYNEGTNEGLDALKTMSIESFVFEIAEHFKAGDAGYIFAEVLDMKGMKAETRKVAITVTTLQEKEKAEEEGKESILNRLREILDLQIYARKSFKDMKKKNSQLLSVVKGKQLDIYNKTLAILRFAETLSVDRYNDLHESLLELSSNQMVDVVRMLDGLELSFTRINRSKIDEMQGDIEKELRRLLGEISSEREEEDDREPEEVEEEEKEGPGSVLKEMRTIMQNFIAEQKRVIASSEQLNMKKPEDFTEEDKELKRKLQIIEDQWAKFLDEKSTELDKMPEQDFSKPTLLKELRQIYEEVDLAADELSKPGIHLPVTEEQVGLELAKKLDAKLESWLVDESDKIKWDMEEPSQDFEVPMAELPEELEDLIGDLIREEEGLDSEMEDVSSSWMDSLDDGAGWATMDGPISNMSAKGKTGNVLPNSSEISGRSAEGRQGKSNGEFVSDTAIGKGGRRTPTRLMDEPYEKGTVNDEMTQETGGATGGGKLSGDGGEGVRGHVPPDVQTGISKVREKYTDVINRGEHIAHQLDKMGYSSEKLGNTIELMRRLDYQMKNFEYGDILGVHRNIVEELVTSKDILGHEIKVRSEENARLPKKIRRLLNDAMGTDFPEDYEELLKGYYKSISR